jgi:hypothetical protein
MLPTDRISYSAIAERAPLKLPDGARMAAWVIVNVEEWNPRETMPRTVLTPPAGGSPIPDIGLAQDQKQADPQPALHAGMQRCRHDAYPASQGVGI